MSDVPTLHEMARDEPDVVRGVADKADDELREWLYRVLEEAGDD